MHVAQQKKQRASTRCRLLDYGNKANVLHSVYIPMRKPIPTWIGWIDVWYSANEFSGAWKWICSCEWTCALVLSPSLAPHPCLWLPVSPFAMVFLLTRWMHQRGAHRHTDSWLQFGSAERLSQWESLQPILNTSHIFSLCKCTYPRMNDPTNNRMYTNELTEKKRQQQRQPQIHWNLCEQAL